MMKRDKQKEIKTYVIIYHHHHQGNSFTLAEYQGPTLIETIGSNSIGILFNNPPSHVW